MHFREPTEFQKRRAGRNIAVAVCLVLLMALLVSLSMVKLTQVGAKEGFDHVRRPALEGAGQ